MRPTPGAGPDGPAVATHRHRHRVRFDEAGPDGFARASTLLRYAQEVAWLHSEALGFDRAWYADRAVGWLVRAAELELLAPVGVRAEVDVTTAVLGFRTAWARRRSEVRAARRLVASVQTDWVLVDSRGTLLRIPPEFGEAFPSPGTALKHARVVLPAPPVTAALRAFRVRPHELDPNGHVNNAAYVDWLEESVLEASTAGHRPGTDVLAAFPRRYRLEYLAGAGPAAELVAETWHDGSGWSHRVGLTDGTEVVRARLET